MLAYNGDRVIGARQWDGSVIDVPAMGYDGNSYSNYIKLPNVITVGGSFIVNKEIIKNKEWNSITENAKLFLTKANY